MSYENKHKRAAVQCFGHMWQYHYLSYLLKGAISKKFTVTLTNIIVIFHQGFDPYKQFILFINVLVKLSF